MFLIPLLLVTVLTGASRGMSPTADGWQSFFFDGTGFREGKGAEGTVVQVKDGFLPAVVSVDGVPTDDPLPVGTGGVAGICYLQTAGGKLRDAGTYHPIAGVAVEFSTGGKRVAVRSDERGFFLVALPAGEYDVRCAGFTRKLRIEKGKTVLLALRGGKRMVD
jgi:hypothetical protein